MAPAQDVPRGWQDRDHASRQRWADRRLYAGRRSTRSRDHHYLDHAYRQDSRARERQSGCLSARALRCSNSKGSSTRSDGTRTLQLARLVQVVRPGRVRAGFPTQIEQGSFPMETIKTSEAINKDRRRLLGTAAQGDAIREDRKREARPVRGRCPLCCAAFPTRIGFGEVCGGNDAEDVVRRLVTLLHPGHYVVAAGNHSWMCGTWPRASSSYPIQNAHSRSLLV